MEEEKKDKNLYEIGFLLDGDLEDTEALSTKKTVEDFLGTLGPITEQGEPVKQPLSYRIMKKKNAYFSWVRFEADSSAPGQIKENLRYNKNILRYIVLKLSPKKLLQENHHERRPLGYARTKDFLGTTVQEGSPSPSEEQTEVDVQELDKKLAEIL